MRADSWERMLLKMDVRGFVICKDSEWGSEDIYVKVFPNPCHSKCFTFCLGISVQLDCAQLANCTIRRFFGSTAEMPTGLASVCISVYLFR